MPGVRPGNGGPVRDLRRPQPHGTPPPAPSRPAPRGRENVHRVRGHQAAGRVPPPRPGRSRAAVQGVPVRGAAAAAGGEGRMTAAAFSTQGLVNWLQGLLAPLFLGAVGIIALFFLFTREIMRFAQFLIMAVAIAVVFYWPGVIQTVASGIAKALGVH